MPLTVLVTACAIAVWMLAAPAPAQAGSFIVYNCDAAPAAPNTLGAPRADDSWEYGKNPDPWNVFEGGKTCPSGASPSAGSNCYGAKAVNPQAGQHATWSAGWFYPGCTQQPGDKLTSPGPTSYGGFWERSRNRNKTIPKSSGSILAFETLPSTRILRFRVKDYLRREGNIQPCGITPIEKCPTNWTVGWVGYTEAPAMSAWWKDSDGLSWDREVYELRGCWNATQFCQIEGTSVWMDVTPAGLTGQWGRNPASVSGNPVKRVTLNITCGDDRIGADGTTVVPKGSGGCPTPYWDGQAHAYSTEVEVEDNVSPTISLNPYDNAAGNSELASNKALKPGVLHDLDYNVADNVGVSSTALFIDGIYWNNKGYPCDFTSRSPCPDQVGVALTGSNEKLEADISSLPEGWHRSEVVGFDAAGNLAVASTGAMSGNSVGGFFYADTSTQLPDPNCDANLGPVDPSCNNTDDNDPGDAPPTDDPDPPPALTGGGTPGPGAGPTPVFSYSLLRNSEQSQRPVRPKDDCTEVGPVPGPLSDHDANQVVTVHIDLRSYFPDRRGMGEQTLKDSFSLRSRLNHEYLYAMGCAY